VDDEVAEADAPHIAGLEVVDPRLQGGVEGLEACGQLGRIVGNRVLAGAGRLALAAAVLVGLSALVILGAVIAWMKYGRDEVPTSVPAGNALTEAARRDLYQDTVNETLFMMPAKGLVTVATVGDASAIDGALNGLGAGSQLLGRIVGITQNGLVRTYAAYILGGVILALAIVLGFRL